MKPISCGLLIHYVPNDEYLLCRTTSIGSIEKRWTVPKGITEEGESDIQCAIRETKEETGLDLSNFMAYFGDAKVMTTKYKIMHIFPLHTDNEWIYNFPFRCDSLIYESKIPELNGLPEVDLFEWMPREKAKMMIFQSMEPLFE